MPGMYIPWRMDETAVPVRGGAHYLYRAVDKHGKTVDSLVGDYVTMCFGDERQIQVHSRMGGSRTNSGSGYEIAWSH